MDEMIGALSSVLDGHKRADFDCPVRSGFHYAQPRPGLLEWMPVLHRGHDCLMKMVGYHPQNPVENGLPTILSTYALFDTASGHLRMILDGTLLTALRTGAASAVASRILAHSDSAVLGLVGCGAQAVTQLHALSRCFKFREVLVYDEDFCVSESFGRRIAQLNLAGLRVRRTTVNEILAESDIVCTATSVEPGHGPVIQDGAHKPHLHINAVGSDFPGKFELPLALLRRAFVAADFLPQAEKEGECQQLEPGAVAVDFVGLIGDASVHAEQRNRLSVFDSTGWALEDLVATELMAGFADEFGLGVEEELESLSADPYDPYAIAPNYDSPAMAIAIADGVARQSLQ